MSRPPSSGYKVVVFLGDKSSNLFIAQVHNNTMDLRTPAPARSPQVHAVSRPARESGATPRRPSLFRLGNPLPKHRPRGVAGDKLQKRTLEGVGGIDRSSSQGTALAR